MIRYKIPIVIEIYVEDFVKKSPAPFLRIVHLSNKLKLLNKEQKNNNKKTKCIFQELYFHIHLVTSLETSVLFPKSPLTWLKITSEHI